MKIEDMSLINKLTNILNNIVYTDPYWLMAKYLVDNIEDFNKINIHKMSEECFVSRATIRRFAIYLGYKNFYDLKRSIDNNFCYKKVSYKKQGDYFFKDFNALTNLIAEYFADINELIKKNNFSRLIKTVSNKKIYCLVSGKLYGILLSFQEELIICKKEFYLFTNAKQCSFSNRENSEIIVISASGKFADTLNETISKVKIKKNLITINQKYKNANYDSVYLMSKKDISDVNIDIFNKYILTYLMDYILNEIRKEKL
ncbi:MAG: hypothetical protein Q4B52_04880 [Tissierellia bacterium]|nr:hypothetical protein [Tissierellia bacterium]